MAKKSRMESNAFAKPDDQIDACISFGMAKKGRMKSSAFLFAAAKVMLFSHSTKFFPNKVSIISNE